MFSKFEKRHEAVLSVRLFMRRMAGAVLLGLGMEVCVVCAGSLGFHYLEGLSWLDAALNTTTIITGNGPPYEAHHAAGKVFQMMFSVLGVVVFALVMSVVLAPVFHRVLHHFHLTPAAERGEHAGG
jgi:hypothetical protein